MLDKMKSSLHQSLPPLTFQLLTDNLTQLATFDCFHYIRWVKKEIIAILVVLGSASFLGWALSASFVLETRGFNVILHGRDEQDLLTAMTILKNINVDALYPTQLFRTLLPTLIDNCPSLLMNITSLSDKGIPPKIATSASRTFLSRMTESLALEMKLEGYDVEALCVRVSRHMGQTDSTLAKAIIARVGNRRSVVVGHWYQFLYKGLIDLLPGWLDNESKGS
ncbi:uncharacterized protein FOBCDRAFT_247962 [Fusarium oxysporum Fo47]|uniref:uncharacterized protein n=1 Tax=Fusarium oxysporum Fo47 TaxID=660027 RepID=UPI002869B83B|nr:uncharacterized protein FOBCDRAFT_247962 [Fusarium oxysporum Fo47]WJG34702.1 hypothetical protein FOBCDRAFT_247962 [Fusarium oxysporum Fo47]